MKTFTKVLLWIFIPITCIAFVVIWAAFPKHKGRGRHHE